MSISRLSMLVGLFVLSTSALHAAFSPGFELPGATRDARAAVVFDDGDGPALYVAGDFGRVDGVSVGRIGRWDGESWSRLAPAGLDDVVWTLAVYDDGGGPALYAGGTFTEAGGVPATGLAKWNGSEWSAVGPGLPGAFEVFALAVYDDGGGPALYVGGDFEVADGAPGNNIVKWDGSSFSPLGSGTDGRVFALETFDDGGGTKLYVGGDFDRAGSVTPNARSIASWDGATWANLTGSSGQGVNGTVHALEVHDDGGGSALYVGGSFLEAGGLGSGVRGLARWSGGEWSAALSGVEFVPVFSLLSADLGAGQVLVAGANISDDSKRLRSWDGSTWTVLADPEGQVLDWTAWGLAAFDEGDGQRLFAAGGFVVQGDVAMNHVGRWDGTSWSMVTSAQPKLGLDSRIRAFEVFDDGGGPALFAGGLFRVAGAIQATNVAKLSEGEWSVVLDDSRRGTDREVLALEVFDDGGGAKLYAAGGFTFAGETLAHGIAAWDGSAWLALGGGLDPGGSSARSLAVFDDVQGPGLYVGGEFDTAGGVPAQHVARWDGFAFQALPGVGTDGTDGAVEALAVYDAGDGPALYVGGRFTTAGGIDAVGIARWDGVVWSALTDVATGLDGDVTALAVYDAGDGPALYAAGEFTSAGGVELNRVGKWDGSTWSALAGPAGVGLGGVATLPEIDGAWRVADVGEGERLYLTGRFTTAGGVAADRLASWDGDRWWPLEGPAGQGLNGGIVAGSALELHDAGDGPALFVGGSFSVAAGLASNSIARFQVPAEIFADGFESGDISAWSSSE